MQYCESEFDVSNFSILTLEGDHSCRTLENEVVLFGQSQHKINQSALKTQTFNFPATFPAFTIGYRFYIFPRFPSVTCFRFKCLRIVYDSQRLTLACCILIY